MFGAIATLSFILIIGLWIALEKYFEKRSKKH